MKTIFKISFIIMYLGWLPFVFLAAYSWKCSVDVRLVVTAVGFVVGMCGLASFGGLIANRTFWMRIKIADDYIAKNRESCKQWQDARDKLARTLSLHDPAKLMREFYTGIDTGDGKHIWLADKIEEFIERKELE